MSEEANVPNAVCAFTVVVDGDGNAKIFRYAIEDVRPLRDPTMVDIRRAVRELESELQAGLVVERVLAAIAAQQEPSVGERVGAALERAKSSGQESGDA